jgi:hypothetical protein
VVSTGVACVRGRQGVSCGCLPALYTKMISLCCWLGWCWAGLIAAAAAVGVLLLCAVYNCMAVRRRQCRQQSSAVVAVHYALQSAERMAPALDCGCLHLCLYCICGCQEHCSVGVPLTRSPACVWRAATEDLLWIICSNLLMACVAVHMCVHARMCLLQGWLLRKLNSIWHSHWIIQHKQAPPLYVPCLKQQARWPL